MQKAICFLPVIPMRKEPSHRSEMVSQILFGEYVQMGEKKEDFVFVRCDDDGYEGWVQSNQLTAVDEGQELEPMGYTSGFVTPVAKNNTLIHVPYGSPVYVQNGFTFSQSGFRFDYLLQPQQVWKKGELKLTLQTLEAITQPYLGVPYLWGGKSVYGIDCSGFVQQVFKLLGVKLLRDAYLQAEQGSPVSSLAESRLGDLAFFKNEAGKITHVGLLLYEEKIIHASGEVRIDRLDESGIYRSHTDNKTHDLHSIRRFF